MYNIKAIFSLQVSQLSEANSHLSARLTTTTKSIARRETQLKQMQKKQDELNDDLNSEGKATNKLLHDLKYEHKRLNKNFEVKRLTLSRYVYKYK